LPEKREGEVETDMIPDWNPEPVHKEGEGYNPYRDADGKFASGPGGKGKAKGRKDKKNPVADSEKSPEKYSPEYWKARIKYPPAPNKYKDKDIGIDRHGRRYVIRPDGYKHYLNDFPNKDDNFGPDLPPLKEFKRRGGGDTPIGRLAFKNDMVKSLDYSDVHIPRLGGNMAEEDDIFEEDKKDEEEEVEKSPDSDLVRGILGQVGDPKLKEMLEGWLSENDLEKEEDIADEEGGGSDVIEEIAEEIAGEVEDIVEEVLGGGGSDEEPEMEKSEDDEEDDLEKCNDDLEKADEDEDEDEVEKDDDEDEEEEPGVEKSWKVPLFKSEEERVVYGVVLEPGTKDLQGDIVRPADVRKACHEFMMKSQKVGHEHNGPAHASIIENYIAPLDFECGGQRVRKGSWIMVTKIHDLNLWEAVKSGDITGYSIGGTGVRTPV